MKMRGLALLAAMVLAATGVQAGMRSAGTSQEKPVCYHGDAETVKGGDSVPWPWGSEIELPWDNLDGVWRVAKGDCNSLFAFLPTKRKLANGTHLTQVIQYDGSTCKKIAWGYGTDSDRVLRSSMSNGRKAFNLTVRAFPRNVAQITPKVSEMTMENMAIVLSMYPKRAWNQRVSYELEKVSNELKPTCQTLVEQ